jgi:glycosyltransferase involved in cell wall biosynthesis
LSAFLACRKSGEELHLYGNGDYAEEIKKIAEKEPSVVYHGSCSNDKILAAERQATLLVNPRTSEGEYTKYSFPSKVLEYMSSGTPVLMARLPGILDEYYNYCYVFDDTDPQGLEISLRKVLDMDAEEIKNLGRTASDFVLGKKNNAVQAKKALDTLKIV